MSQSETPTALVLTDPQNDFLSRDGVTWGMVDMASDVAVGSSFRDKYGPWALVTGASSGMGAAFARQVAARGLNVVLVTRREDRLRALSEDLKRSGSAQTRVAPADLSRDDFIPRLAEATDGLQINLLVNNAGLGVTGECLANDLGAELGMLHLNCRAPLCGRESRFPSRNLYRSR